MTMRMGIIGAGNIANSMAMAICGLKGRVEPYAVAARDLGRAEEFAQKWGFSKAYGSYEELAEDPNVDLIYVATPHSHHYEHARLCLLHHKPVLVEKAFTANRRMAEELIQLSRENHVFLAEAMWTRFLPAAQMIKKLLEDGVIGTPQSITAEFSVPIEHKQRMYDPNLAGGALLDLGIYALTFASMYFGDNIESETSVCRKYHTGVDATDDISVIYADGKTAKLRTSFVSGPINEGTIVGTNGSLHVDNLNNYSSIKRLNPAGEVVEEYAIPEQINGYEYEVLACMEAMAAGKTECSQMPHSETLLMMGWMDRLRQEWGVVYPFE